MAPVSSEWDDDDDWLGDDDEEHVETDEMGRPLLTIRLRIARVEWDAACRLAGYVSEKRLREKVGEERPQEEIRQERDDLFHALDVITDAEA